MTTMETMNQIFQNVFDDDTIQINPAMTANDIDGWDSLSHVNLILAVEAEFRIRFNNKELLLLKKVGDLYSVIENKLQSKRQ